jgi:ATP-binding cassette, subfamily C, bacteriocin exporter
MLNRMKGFYQYNEEDCGAACLATVLHFYNNKTTISVLRNEMNYDKKGANVLSIIEVAKKYGLEAEAYEGNYEELKEQIRLREFQYPMIVHIEREDRSGHFLVIKKIHKDKVKVFDPRDGNITLTADQFIEMWTGVVICFVQNKITNITSKEEKPFQSYQRYLKILYREKKIFFSVIFLSILISLIAFLGAWVYKIVIDNYILNEPINDGFVPKDFNFIALITSLLIFYLFQTALSLIKNIFNAKAVKSLSNKLSESFLQHLVKVPPKSLSRFETGEILSRFQSISEIQQSYLIVILTLTTEIIGALVGGIILFSLSHQLFFYVLIMIAIYSIIFTVFLPLLKKNRKKYYTHYSESITALNQTLSGSSTILMQKSSIWFLDKIIGKINKTNSKQYNIGVLEGTASSLVTLTESVGSLAILARGSQLVIQGTLSLGSLVAFQSMMMSFISPIQQLVLVQNEIQNLRVLTQRLDDLYEVKTERVELPIVKKEILQSHDLRFENVSFSYYYNQNIFENINLEVKEGSKVGVAGNSGRGKTTMLKIMASLYSPTNGTVYLGEKPYSRYSLDTLREDIAYVDQMSFVFEGTILDNLLMGTPLREVDVNYINKVAEICGLYHLDPSNLNDLEMLLAENGDNLSGGQKQKIGVARALINKPKLLLLDEATSNIDEESKHKILSYIFSLEGTTVISISHDKNTLQYCDQCLLMENNQIKMIQVEKNDLVTI